MKRRIIAMALSIALGISVFGGSVQAASVSDCSHPTLHYAGREEIGYDPDASGIFHNIIYRIKYECDNPECDYKIYDYEYEYEYHVYDIYENGYWYCSICGRRDD